MDVSKLAPLPVSVQDDREFMPPSSSPQWTVVFNDGSWATFETEAEATFHAMARHAFDGDPDALATWEKERRRR